MAVTLPFETDPVPPAAPRDHRWSVAVFTSREDLANAIATIDAVLAALDGHETVVDVLVNGNDDLAGQLASHYQAMHNLAPSLTTMRIWQLPVHDKALTWNAFMHAIAPDADVVFCVDGYARVASNALTALADRLRDSPAALAAAAVPSVGRSAALMRARMLRDPKIYGSLYALRGDTVGAIRQAAFRVPIGMYRGDGLLSSALALNLTPASAQWSHDRIAVAEHATWSRRPDPLTSRRGARTQTKRLVRQAFGVLEALAFRDFLTVQRAPLANLPSTDLALVTGWMQRHPTQAAATLARHPLALLEVIRLSRADWTSREDAPRLIGSTSAYAAPRSAEHV